MRATQLATIALQAEKLRLQRRVKQIITRIAFGAIAVVLFLFALGFAHLAGYAALQRDFAPYWAALIVGGMDIVLALLLFLFAKTGKPDLVATEAEHVRNDAWKQMQASLALGVALGPLSKIAARIIGRKPVLGLALSALMAAGFFKRA